MDASVESPNPGNMNVLMVGGTGRDYARAQIKFKELGVLIPWHYESDKAQRIKIPVACDAVIALRWVSHSRLENVIKQTKARELPFTIMGLDTGTSRQILISLREKAGFTSIPKPIADLVPMTTFKEEKKNETTPTPVLVPSTPPAPRAPADATTQLILNDIQATSDQVEARLTKIEPQEETKTPMKKISGSEVRSAVLDLLQTGQASVPDLLGMITGDRAHPAGSSQIRSLIDEKIIEVCGSAEPLRANGKSGGQASRIVRLTEKSSEARKKSHMLSLQDRMNQILDILSQADHSMSADALAKKMGTGRRVVYNYLHPLVVDKKIEPIFGRPIEYTMIKNRTAVPQNVSVEKEKPTQDTTAGDLRGYFLTNLTAQLKNPKKADQIILTLLRAGLLDLR